jgi:hypothetical protein
MSQTDEYPIAFVAPHPCAVTSSAKVTVKIQRHRLQISFVQSVPERASV